MSLRLSAGTPALQSGDIAGTLLLDRSTWSASHSQTIHDWHRDCQLRHKECNRSVTGHEEINPEDVPLPTRCVEFEFLDKRNPWTSSIQWTLRETEGRSGKYIALSHRWVEETVEANTTRENYADRVDTWDQAQEYHTLARGKLNALFLDVGRLACHLGIRYVWIDSLCIIQDDKDDWTRESTKMADYYQHSWLTVAVTSPSDNGGIFQQHGLKIPRVTRLPYYDKKGEQSGHFYVQAGTDKVWADDYFKTIATSELRKRAWVFQEWRLSRRILAPSNQGMFLHCQSESPKSLDGFTVDTSWESAEVADAFRTRRKLDMDSSESDILYAWELVAEEYSGLRLTKEEDRLVALAGIAREYGRALAHQANANDELQRKYLCGLWTGWLQGLLWEQANPSTQIRTKGFPTWSWLSIAETIDVTKGLSGLRVQWPLLKSSDMAVCECLSPILVPVTDDWEPMFEKAGEHELQYLHSDPHRDLDSEHYGNVIHFAILQMIGKKLDVSIDWYFESPQDIEIAATMTAHEMGIGRRSNRCSWRKACLKSSPNIIIGWASIEHPDFQTDQAFTSTMPISAFVVGQVSKVTGGLGLGHISGFHTVLKVLYVSRVEIAGRSDCYERIGVGRLFGDSVHEALDSSSKTKINLV